MNIAVLTFGDKKNYSFRPDTTLNRDGADFYCPQYVSPTIVPCIYTKILKSAKSVDAKFAPRYCDSYDFGIMINDASANGIMGSYLDNSSLFKCCFKPLAEEAGRLVLAIDGRQYMIATPFSKECFFDAVTTISSRSTLRTGDIVAIELAKPFVLTQEEHTVTLSCESYNILNFRIL